MGATLWKIDGHIHDLSRRGMIMGVLNVTPDSFSDGDRFFDVRRAVEHGLRMVAEGAQIVDIGGESTRPGAEPVDAATELDRVLPVIHELRSAVSALISIDTAKAEVARAALAAGANMVNDVSGGTADPDIFPLVRERHAALIIMHRQGKPRTMQIAPKYDDVVVEVADFFRQQRRRAINCGIDPMSIAFDPGIGFGKTLEHNLDLLRNLPRLRIDDRPLVVGVSRKSFLGKLVTSTEMADRHASTVALTALLRERGADILRVHDVKENVQALRMAETLMGSAQ